MKNEVREPARPNQGGDADWVWAIQVCRDNKAPKWSDDDRKSLILLSSSALTPQGVYAYIRYLSGVCAGESFWVSRDKWSYKIHASTLGARLFGSAEISMPVKVFSALYRGVRAGVAHGIEMQEPEDETLEEDSGDSDNLISDDGIAYAELSQEPRRVTLRKASAKMRTAYARGFGGGRGCILMPVNVDADGSETEAVMAMNQEEARRAVQALTKCLDHISENQQDPRGLPLAPADGLLGPWFADDPDAERIQGSCGGSTPEEAALEYLTGWLDPADGKTRCLAHRRPTVEEQIEFHLANVDVDEILENLSVRAEDEGGEVFEGWLEPISGEAKERLGRAISAAVREYLVETGSVGAGNPWIPAESVEMELVDGEVRRVAPEGQS